MCIFNIIEEIELYKVYKKICRWYKMKLYIYISNKIDSTKKDITNNKFIAGDHQ